MRDFILRILREQSFYTERATVTAVDPQAMTCTVTTTASKTELFNVIIGAYRGATFGMYAIPVVGSVVAVAYYSRNEAYITKMGAIESVQLDMGTSEGEGVTLTIIDGVITVNGGELGGLIAIADLTTKINDLVGTVDAILNDYAAHTHPTAAVGAPSPPTVPVVIPAPAQFAQGDYENEDILHGRVVDQ